MRYGILGGTFDPPHIGHTAVAEAAIKHLQLDDVVFIPAARNPLKRSRATAAAHRLEMTKLAVLGHDRFLVSDIEISRGGRSFTIDTVEELLLTRPGQIWVLLGADALGQLPSWRSPERLVKLCRIGAVVRPPLDIDRVVRTLPPDLREAVDIVPMPENKISSSDIRQTIALGRSAERWLDPKVWEYISERGLYQEEE